MATQIIHLERSELNAFCIGIPAPKLARPVVLANRGQAMALAFDIDDGQRLMLTEQGHRCTFSSIDAIMIALDGVENLSMDRLAVDTSAFWTN